MSGLSIGVPASSIADEIIKRGFRRWRFTPEASRKKTKPHAR
jgi:hypothetical protein